MASFSQVVELLGKVALQMLPGIMLGGGNFSRAIEKAAAKKGLKGAGTTKEGRFFSLREEARGGKLGLKDLPTPQIHSNSPGFGYSVHSHSVFISQSKAVAPAPAIAPILSQQT